MECKRIVCKAERTEKKKEREFMAKLLSSTKGKIQVLALQETHGNLEAIMTFYPELAKRFHVFASDASSLALGGVAILIARTLVADGG